MHLSLKLRPLAGCIVALVATSAWSFDLSPKGTRYDRATVKAWAPTWLDDILSSLADKGLEKFKTPVHEEITHRIYECNYEGPVICGDPDAQYATPYVIAGVRWNDDPPFQMNSDQARDTACKTTYADGRPMTIRFITQPRCWAQLFLAAEKQIQNGSAKSFDLASRAALPLRSHLGDLQFIHSMASADGESPQDTRDKILGWAELSWGVVRGDLKLETWLKDVEVPVVHQHFGTTGWRVQDLFALGDPSLRAHVSDVAFGSLLHMVQDSFAAGHVDRLDPAGGARCQDGPQRAPGPIMEFHSYTHQNSDSHALADTRQAFLDRRLTPDVVDVGRVLVALRADNAPWEQVKDYLSCVYELAPGARPATAGNF